MPIIIIRLIILISLFSSTLEGMAATSKKKKKDYIEKLSVHRIIFDSKKKEKLAIPQLDDQQTYDVTGKLNEILKKNKELHQKESSLSGYTVQAYTGGSRTMANRIYEKIVTHFPFSYPTIHYIQPFYTVCVGFLLERIETYPIYLALKRKIPSTITRKFSFSWKDYQSARKSSETVIKST